MNKTKAPTPDHKSKIALSIAGLDPSGGAGIIADLKTFAAFGCYGTAAVTSVTFQNTLGVFGAEHQTASSVRRQVGPIFEDFAVDAVKTGMLPTRGIIEEIALMAIEFGFANFVVDPVVRSTSGFDLIDDGALKSLIENLFPLATVITPNVAEAERISKTKIETYEDIVRAANLMRDLGARAVLLKGGHLPNLDLGAESDTQEGESSFDGAAFGRRKAIDFLFVDGDERWFSADFIDTTATHGTGCTLAAAITAGLANGGSLIDAVDAAKRYVSAAIRTAPNIGKGHSPINHLISDF